MKSEMKYKLLAILSLFCLVWSACGTAENESYETEDSANEIIVESGNAAAGVLDEPDIKQVAEFLNHDLLSTSSLTSAYWVEEMIQESICDYAEIVQEPFAPVVNEDSVFPDELVAILEEALYNTSSLDIRDLDVALYYSSSSSLVIRPEDNFYYRTLTELGANECNMSLEKMIAAFPELEATKDQLETKYDAFPILHEKMDAPYQINDIFHMEGNQYLFEYKSGGSNGVMSLCLTEYAEGRFNVLMDFEVRDRGNGMLIKYGQDFYFVYLQLSHYSPRDYDGIGIYKIGENVVADNLQIRFLPKEYIWESMGYASGFPGLEDYIDFLQNEIVSGEQKYLDMGYYKALTISGDEAEVTDIETDNLEYPSREIYQADIANLGIPVYMQRIRKWSFENDYEVNFYLRDPQTNMLLELDQLSIKEDNTNCLKLVDIWFKEIDNKTLTFSIYHVSDYSYMLNIVLLEGGEARPVQSWLLLPVKEFVLTEGEAFSTAG